MHPTRRCNLACLHCYSASGPRVSEELASDILEEAISDASAEGYDVLGVSGGEPTLYRPLPTILRRARASGMRTTVTTNGMLLSPRYLGSLNGLVSLLAISLDGQPSAHNRMRQHPRAFEILCSRLDDVRAAGIPFGFIFTLTQYNVHELRWVAEFAATHGASLLQIHPLEPVGRAVDRCQGESPDETEMGVALLESIGLEARLGDRLTVQLDVASCADMRAEPDKVFASPDGHDDDGVFSRMLSPLVIETDGTVVPLKYGFPRQYALGNLRDAPLSSLAHEWRRHGYAAFRMLACRVHKGLTADADARLTNWYEAMAQEAMREMCLSRAGNTWRTQQHPPSC